MNIKIKKSNGYTLIELILYVGIAALLSIGIYKYYDRKSTEVYASQLSDDLTSIDKSLQGTCVALGCNSVLTTSYVINYRVAPTYMISGTNLISKFGGGKTIQYAPSSTIANTYDLSLLNLQPYQCVKVIGSEYGRNIPQSITVNGTSLPMPFSSATVSAAATSCNSASNLVVMSRTIITPLVPPTGNLGVARAKESAINIPALPASVSSTVTSCTGGATWNGSFCGCPVNTAWNGTTCQTFNVATAPGWCAPGQGWIPGTKTCGTLPNGSSSGSYVGNRYVPSTVTTAPYVTTVAGTVAPASGSTTISGKTINWNNGTAIDGTVNTCVNGTFDSSTKRCVTP